MSYQWKAFQSERRKYMNLLQSKKVDYMQSEILKHQYDSKQLYKLVSEPTGKKIENIMPESFSDVELAEKFAPFFIEKIAKIRNNLDQHPLYTPLVQPMPILLENFIKLLEGDVHKLIMKLQMKSCELDPIPMHILKDNLDSFLPCLQN